MASNQRRIDLDIMKLIESKYSVTIVDLSEILVEFHGPKNSCYEGGVWTIRVQFPGNYPYKAPKVSFINKIYHANIKERSGNICLDIMSYKWTPLYNLNNIFDTFLPQLLLYPNPDDPLNRDAATLYLKQPEAYKNKVTEYIQRYASADKQKEEDNSNYSDSESTFSELSELSDVEENNNSDSEDITETKIISAGETVYLKDEEEKVEIKNERVDENKADKPEDDESCI